MRPFELPLYATLSLCAGPLLFYRSFRDLRKRRLILDTPTSRIRSMAMGRVEVLGEVEGRSRVKAPFSDRPCVYWQIDIAVRARRGWAIVHRDSSRNAFYVRDDTGIAMVDPRGAECRVENAMEESCPGMALPDCYASYMSARRLRLRFLWRVGVMRFRERILAEADRVYVMGSAAPRARARALRDEDALAATGTDGPISAAPRDRVAARDDASVAVIRKGPHDPVFLISSRPERDLTLDLGLAAVGNLVAGPVLTLLGMAYWIHALAVGRP